MVIRVFSYCFCSGVLRGSDRQGEAKREDGDREAQAKGAHVPAAGQGGG